MRIAIPLVLLALAAPLDAQTDPSIVGQYSARQLAPFKAIHAHLLPTGKVMFWDSYDDADHAQLWDPATGSFTPSAPAQYNIFCTGFSFLANGHLLVTGGHIADFEGLPNTTDYDPFTNTWTPLANMNAGRWYPTNTTLANGDVLVVSGQVDNTVGMDPLPQVWQVGAGSWRDLTSAQLVLPFYPYMYLAPNGQVFNAGPNQTTRYLNTAGTGAWTVVNNSLFGTRTWGSSVMYGIGRVMIAGGTQCPPYDSSCLPTPTNTVETIDLTSPSPSWAFAAPMANPRKQLNLTLLPDGTVLATGGSAGSEFETAESTSPVYAAELWNPATNTWNTMASLSVFRGYHSTAVLLPDGRVFSGGGNFDSTYEVFSPPYLFKGARPTVTSAPASVGYGQTFSVATPDAAGITKVTWLSLSAVTHAFNAGQRINFLNFSQASGGLNVTSPSDPNLCPPGYYMLFLINSNGVPSVASMVRIDGSIVPPPAAPTGLTATASSSSQINLSWTDASNNESGFNILQSTDGVNFTQVATVGSNVTTYSRTGLSPSTTYYFRVQAFNSSGSSGFSNTASTTTLAGPPASPTGLTATASSSSQINLSWIDASNNESGFNILQSTDGVNFTQVATVGSNVTAYSRTGLSPSTTYYFRVQAFNSSGSSGFSNTASTTTLAAPPATPTGLTATASSSSQINLSWTDASNNESGFNILQSTDGVNFAQVATVGANVTTYSRTGLSPSTTYYFRVQAFNSGGSSGFSNTASTTTLAGPPASPTGLTATASSSSQINLSWTDASNNESGFNILQSTDGVNFAQVATVGANVTTYPRTGLSPSTTYYFRVQAFNSGGSSGFSNTASAMTLAGPPASPTGLTATASSSSRVNLSWTDASNNESGFNILQSTNGVNFTRVATVGANVTTYSRTGLSPSTTYYFRVRAFNGSGFSGFSNTASATTLAALPAAPTNLTATARPNSRIDLGWQDRSNNENGFAIERSTDGAIFSQIATVGPNVRSYTNNGLTGGVLYFYRVRAFNNSGNSGYSNIASARP